MGPHTQAPTSPTDMGPHTQALTSNAWVGEWDESAAIGLMLWKGFFCVYDRAISESLITACCRISSEKFQCLKRMKQMMI